MAPDADDSGSLTILLEPVEDYCEVGEQGQGAVQVRWRVTGGEPPYRVWVGDEQSEDSVGVASVQCATMRTLNYEFEEYEAEAPLRAGPLLVHGVAEDSGGTRVSVILPVNRLIVLLAENWQEIQSWEGLLRFPFAGPGWFSIAGKSFFVPQGEWHVSHRALDRHDVRLSSEYENQSFYVRVHLDSGEEYEREINGWDSQQRDFQTRLDLVVEGIGSVPPRTQPVSSSVPETLSISFDVPAFCYGDETVRERSDPSHGLLLDWDVEGGVGAYTVLVNGGVHLGRIPTPRLPCQRVVDGVADSGSIAVPLRVVDAYGLIGSIVAHTYVIMPSAVMLETGQRVLNGGRTYEFWGHLMTIPEGLTIDIGASIAGEETNFTIGTLGGTVWATFNDYTGQMIGRGDIHDGWQDDPGVDVDSIEELQELIDEWAESIGREPVVNSAR